MTFLAYQARLGWIHFFGMSLVCPCLGWVDIGLPRKSYAETCDGVSARECHLFNTPSKGRLFFQLFFPLFYLGLTHSLRVWIEQNGIREEGSISLFRAAWTELWSALGIPGSMTYRPDKTLHHRSQALRLLDCTTVSFGGLWLKKKK